MECVETGECLWTVTNRHVFGFRIEKLLELGKNELRRWRSNLVPPPSDFHFKLPARDMRPFLLHSNLHFTGAPLRPPSCHYQLSYVSGTTLDLTEAGPPPPTLVYKRFHVANFQGVDDHSWRQLIKLSFSYCEDGHHSPSVVPVSSLGDVGNCSVAMTWSRSMEDFPLKIHALLVDNQEYYCIRGKQCLEEASEAIVPDFFDSSIDINVNFVDRGKGKVCVVIGGVTGRECVLCVLVLGLSLLQEHDQSQIFLSVDVLANQVYDMLPYTDKHEGFEVPYTSFLLSLKQDHVSPMKKLKPTRISRWDKLVGLIYPTMLTTVLEQE